MRFGTVGTPKQGTEEGCAIREGREKGPPSTVDSDRVAREIFAPPTKVDERTYYSAACCISLGRRGWREGGIVALASNAT